MCSWFYTKTVSYTHLMSMEQRKNFRLNYEPVELRPMLENLISQHRLKADKPTEFKPIWKKTWSYAQIACTCTTWSATVSYTHLDVYKRQIRVVYKGIFFFQRSQKTSQTHDNAGFTLRHSHVLRSRNKFCHPWQEDVYKRQGTRWWSEMYFQ